MKPRNKNNSTKTEMGKSSQQNTKNSLKSIANYGAGLKNQTEFIVVTTVIVICAISILMVLSAMFYENNKQSQSSSSEYYIACGCGCCGGVEPQVKCLYYAKGDNLQKIINDDKKIKQSSNCKVMGCSPPIKYKYCDTKKNNTNINTNKNININMNTNTNENSANTNTTACSNEYCAQFHYGTCPAGCKKQCLPSQCSDTPTGWVCTADCEGPGNCSCEL